MPGGRPTKFTVERTQIIVDALEEGQTLKVAVARAGLAYETLHGWLEKGRAAKSGQVFRFL
jgi:hypothetical protein